MPADPYGAFKLGVRVTRIPTSLTIFYFCCVLQEYVHKQEEKKKRRFSWGRHILQLVSWPRTCRNVRERDKTVIRSAYLYGDKRLALPTQNIRTHLLIRKCHHKGKLAPWLWRKQVKIVEFTAIFSQQHTHTDGVGCCSLASCWEKENKWHTHDALCADFSTSLRWLYT